MIVLNLRTGKTYYYEDISPLAALFNTVDFQWQWSSLCEARLRKQLIETEFCYTIGDFTTLKDKTKERGI